MPPEEKQEKRSAAYIAAEIADQISNSHLNAMSSDEQSPPAANDLRLSHFYKMNTIAGPNVKGQRRFLSHDLITYSSKGHAKRSILYRHHANKSVASVARHLRLRNFTPNSLKA